MDYPKSVPGVGLVDGKFVDENTATGQPGSLIPCGWGNAVTDEILSVIEAASLEPGEADHGQLLQAIGILVDAALPELPGEATATVLGLVKQASKQDAEEGTDDKKSMSALRVHQAIAKKAPAAAVVVSTAASKVLVAGDLGLVLVDSTAAATTITLPASDGALGIRDVIVRRVDNGGNRLTVMAAGTDKVKFHTHLRAEGYPFFVLMGAGDYWHLRSDGAGSWFPISRFDGTPVGRLVFETTTAFQPGGWGAQNGFIYNRAEWPWVWDHAQASGMLTTEALRAGNEGKWTSGDGASTFRAPEARGEFIRLLDESRGIDVSRGAGSWQKGTVVAHDSDRGPSLTPVAVGSTVAGGSVGSEAIGADPYMSQAASYSLQFSYSTSVGAVAVADIYAGIARPRNIAYPGRLKLI